MALNVLTQWTTVGGALEASFPRLSNMISALLGLSLISDGAELANFKARPAVQASSQAQRHPKCRVQGLCLVRACTHAPMRP